MSVVRESLLAGNSEQKEQAALLMRTLVEFASVDALKPHIVGVTGPLIRVLGDRSVIV